jgi:hypothetical protein
MWRFRYYFSSLQTGLWRLIVRRVLPLVARDRLQFFKRLRGMVDVLILVAIVLTIAAPFVHLVKMIAIAGLMFDVAGVIRLFMDEEWAEIIEHFADEKKYPRGPPSYITRELFANENVEVAGDTDHNSIERYFYYRRGFLLIILGFVWQAVAVILA